eukprot:CAMPEP_0178414324 /NCGR_PEP_ID=MMETSP0689_2-20121128/22978_1 /TAXON_ID=160604 /ORGANISM="Amphidinium massartii, Strain CS-259" /LENGTH=396 /DNA_ID=CAMNT_0020035611 /DNA_START=102 /DNA_END=1289 /DNA_ORIENTATION=+
MGERSFRICIAVVVLCAIEPILAVQMPTFTNRQFILISSATERNIAYAELQNFQALSTRAYPLVDTGLVEPRGIAFDRERSNLYVADYGAQAIYRYSVMLDHDYVQNGTSMTRLICDAGRETLLEGVNTSYVHVDRAGNLYFTDATHNSVNKVQAATLQQMFDGSLQGADLRYVNERTLVSVSGSEANAQLAPVTASAASAGDTASSTLLEIHQLYDGTVHSHASLPGPVGTSGNLLFWGNQRGGTVNGSLIRGETEPRVPALQGSGSEPAPFPTLIASRSGTNATGLTVTSNMVLWSDAGLGVVKAIQKSDTSGASIELAAGLGTPFGLEWDGENTAYVADKDAGVVFSFPVGRFVEDVPLKQVVSLNGAYGVAVFTESDDAFSRVYNDGSSSWF